MARPIQGAVRRQRMFVGCSCLAIAALLFLVQRSNVSIEPHEALLQQLHSHDAANRSHNDNAS